MVGDEKDTREDEWQFGVDEVGVQGDESGDHPDEQPHGAVVGGSDRRIPVEPESVDLEHALFVLFGAATTLVVFAQFVVG